MLLFIELITVLLTAPSFIESKYAADCMTPNNVNGKCMPMKSCASALELFLEVQRNQNVEQGIAYLRDSQCDFIDNMPYVCCPQDQIQMNPDVLSHLQKMDCGINGHKKIAKGDIANLFDYRWMALLVYEGTERLACGGALIDDRHVLTAAHCLHNSKLPPVAVRLGEYNLTNEEDCAVFEAQEKCLGPIENIDIESTIQHEDYKYKGLNHDIAIIRLKRSVECKRHIRPICLPITEELRKTDVDKYLVAGWGLTEQNVRSNVLKWTAVPKQPTEFCWDKLGLHLNNGHICAGGEKFHDTCQGDSGGPLFQSAVYVDGVMRSTQFGIVSAGINTCGDRNLPAIYTNVVNYLQWITDHILINDDNTNNKCYMREINDV